MRGLSRPLTARNFTTSVLDVRLLEILLREDHRIPKVVVLVVYHGVWDLLVLHRHVVRWVWHRLITPEVDVRHLLAHSCSSCLLTASSLKLRFRNLLIVLQILILFDNWINL